MPRHAHLDHYAVLGVAPAAAAPEIEAAYRAAAKRWHPDRNPRPDASERMREINVARDVLADPAARAAYDAARRAEPAPDPPPRFRPARRRFAAARRAGGR